MLPGRAKTRELASLRYVPETFAVVEARSMDQAIAARPSSAKSKMRSFIAVLEFSKWKTGYEKRGASVFNYRSITVESCVPQSHG
jgi:hypothetical protein